MMDGQTDRQTEMVCYAISMLICDKSGSWNVKKGYS